MTIAMSENNSFKRKARQRQKATGDSYMRARRDVANIDAASAVAIPGLATEAMLLSLLGFDHVGPIDVSNLWDAHDLLVATNEPVALGTLLQIPLGLKENGAPIWLDLKEQSAGGDGPHGLLVGVAGSGKSSVLNAMLFALCARHSPKALQLVLIEHDGFSGLGDFAGYPHAVFLPSRGDYKAALRELITVRTEALRAADAITLDYPGVASTVDGTEPSTHPTWAASVAARLDSKGAAGAVPVIHGRSGASSVTTKFARPQREPIGRLCPMQSW